MITQKVILLMLHLKAMQTKTHLNFLLVTTHLLTKNIHLLQSNKTKLNTNMKKPKMKTLNQ